MLGYLCLEIICSLRFEENCSLHSTDKVRRQISEHTVLHQMVFFKSNVFMLDVVFPVQNIVIIIDNSERTTWSNCYHMSRNTII